MLSKLNSKKVKYILVSNTTLEGLDQIMDFIQKGKTYCVVGSSGVGKSTLVNNLLKKNMLKTGQVSQSTNKGRHITEHRELFVLKDRKRKLISLGHSATLAQWDIENNQPIKKHPNQKDLALLIQKKLYQANKAI